MKLIHDVTFHFVKYVMIHNLHMKLFYVQKQPKQFKSLHILYVSSKQNFH